MALAKEFLGEGHALVAALGSRELQKLARGEVPGMCGHEVEKASLVFGVAEAAEVGETEFREVHRLKMTAFNSRSSRMRRKRSASTGRAELWKRARGLGASTRCRQGSF